MKKIYFAFLSFPIVLIFSAAEIFEVTNTNQIFGNIMQSILGSESADEVFLQGFCVGCIVPVLFSVFYGTYFYHDLMIGGVYIFTRQKSRIKWYISHCLRLTVYAVIYSVIFTLTKYCISFGFSSNLITIQNIVSSINICISVIQIGIVGAIIINTLVILFGSGIGYSAGIGIIFCLLGAGYVTRFSNAVLMSVNPFSSYIRAFGGGFDTIRFFVQITSIILVLSLGYISVRKMDIGLSNKEI